MFWIKTPPIFDQLFRDVTWRMPVTDQTVFITFDDGPHPDITPFILDQLEACQMKATFFLLGKQVEQYPELYQSIIKAGHLTAHHSFSHLNGWHTDSETYLADVDRAAQIIPSNFFRPPYGKLTRGEWVQLKSKYQIVMWSLMPEDWRDDITADKVLDRLTTRTVPGDIIVLHENDLSREKIKDVFPKYLSFLKSKNMTSNRLDYAD